MVLIYLHIHIYIYTPLKSLVPSQLFGADKPIPFAEAELVANSNEASCEYDAARDDSQLARNGLIPVVEAEHRSQ
jgi:hypothetical protein